MFARAHTRLSLASVALLFVLLVGVAVVPYRVTAQDDEGDVAEDIPVDGEGAPELLIQDNEDSAVRMDTDEDGMIGPSEDVFLSSVIPEQPHPPRSVPAGSIVEVALTFENRGEDAMNVTGIMAHLMYEWQQYVQNYSMTQEPVIVEPGNMASLLYRFRPDPAIDPHEFGVLGRVFYTDADGQEYMSIFNQTIFLLEAEDETEYGTLMLNSLVMAGAGFAMWYVLNSHNASMATKSKKEIGASPGKSQAGGGADWLEGTANTRRRSAGKGGSRR